MLETCLVFFCGCGGADWGLHEAGLKCILAIDNNDRYRVPVNEETPSKNWEKGKEGKDWLWKSSYPAIEMRNANLKDGAGVQMDMLDFNPKGVSADVIWMSPPCKRFSSAAEDRNLEEADDSFVFMDEYIKNLSFVAIEKAMKVKGVQYIIMENVDALHNERNHSYLDKMIKQFNDGGFNVEYNCYDAQYLGLCQKRKRLILVASAKGKTDLLPSIPQQPRVKLGEIIDRYKGWEKRTKVEVWNETTYGTFVSKWLADAGIMHFIVDDMVRYRTKMTDRAIDLYDDLLPTVTCGWNGGPTRKKMCIIDPNIGNLGIPAPRCPTVVEGMRAQGFPEEWFDRLLDLDKAMTWTMTGNAVPTKLAYYMGLHLCKDDKERKLTSVKSLTEKDAVVLTRKRRRLKEREENAIVAPWDPVEEEK